MVDGDETPFFEIVIGWFPSGMFANFAADLEASITDKFNIVKLIFIFISPLSRHPPSEWMAPEFQLFKLFAGPPLESSACVALIMWNTESVRKTGHVWTKTVGEPGGISSDPDYSPNRGLSSLEL
jgi:hypothetical protein